MKVSMKLSISFNSNKGAEAKAAFIKEVEGIFYKVSKGDKWQNRIDFSNFKEESVIDLYCEYCSKTASSGDLLAEFKDLGEAPKSTAFAETYNENLHKLMEACAKYALKKSGELKGPQLVEQQLQAQER